MPEGLSKRPRPTRDQKRLDKVALHRALAVTYVSARTADACRSHPPSSIQPQPTIDSARRRTAADCPNPRDEMRSLILPRTLGWLDLRCSAHWLCRKAIAVLVVFLLGDHLTLNLRQERSTQERSTQEIRSACNPLGHSLAVRSRACIAHEHGNANGHWHGHAHGTCTCT